MTNFSDLFFAGESKRFEAADEAAKVVGNYDKGKTRELAESIRRSPDVVERLARAGRFYANIAEYDPKTSAFLRNSLKSPAWFEAAGRAFEDGMSLHDLLEALMDAVADESMTLEAFRSMIREGKSGTWSDRTRKMLPRLKRHAEGPFDGSISDKEAHRMSRHLAAFVAEAEAHFD